MKNIKCWYIIIGLIFLSGCGIMQYRTVLYIGGEKKAEVKSNVPSFVKGENYEIDQRRESLWEKVIPKTLKVGE